MMRVSVAFSLGKVVRLSSHGCDLCLLCLVSVGTVLVCGTALPAEASAARRHTRKREERLRKENGEKDSKQVCNCDGKRLPRRRFLDAQCNDACYEDKLSFRDLESGSHNIVRTSCCSYKISISTKVYPVLSCYTVPYVTCQEDDEDSVTIKLPSFKSITNKVSETFVSPCSFTYVVSNKNESTKLERSRVNAQSQSGQ
eukprot:8711949-Pyramimonas_sp.AAC.1